MRGWLGARSQFDYGDEDVAEDEMNAADEMREKAAQASNLRNAIMFAHDLLEAIDFQGDWGRAKDRMAGVILGKLAIRSLPAEGTGWKVLVSESPKKLGDYLVAHWRPTNPLFYTVTISLWDGKSFAYCNGKVVTHWRELPSPPAKPESQYCSSCGYTKADQDIHGDHHLCPNAGNAPWEKPESQP